jgi:hypothetical protein
MPANGRVRASRAPASGQPSATVEPWSTSAPERDLAGEIAALLADGRSATVEEVARAIRVRTQFARELLRTDERFCGPLRIAGRSARAKLYALAAHVADGPGRDGTGA